MNNLKELRTKLFTIFSDHTLVDIQCESDNHCLKLDENPTVHPISESNLIRAMKAVSQTAWKIIWKLQRANISQAADIKTLQAEIQKLKGDLTLTGGKPMTVEDLMKMRAKTNSDGDWSIDSEPYTEGRWSTYQDKIVQDITHVIELEYEAEEKLINVGTECVGAHGDGNGENGRLRYIVALHNALPSIVERVRALEAQANGFTTADIEKLKKLGEVCQACEDVDGKACPKHTP